MTRGTYGQPLTKAELEVLQYRANGGSEEMIAVLRGTSRATVKEQLQAVRDKLGAHNTAHAIYLALRAGLIQ